MSEHERDLRPDLYFLHIPKTAGTSLAAVIRGAYRPDETSQVSQVHELKGVPREQLQRYRCYTGHFGTGLYGLVDRPLVTVTMLREPGEQLLSQVRFAERMPQLLTPLALRAWRWTWERVPVPWFRHLIEEPYVSIELRDLQTRCLGVDLDLRPHLEGRDRRHFYRLLYDTQQGQPMSEILARAKQRLDGMAVVGIVERFAESIELICALLGIPVPPDLPMENVAPGRTPGRRHRDSSKISPDYAELVERLTENDRELYAHGCRLFDAQLARHRAQLRGT